MRTEFSTNQISQWAGIPSVTQVEWKPNNQIHVLLLNVYDKTQKMTIACHFIPLLTAICSDSLHESHSFSVTIVNDATKLSRTELLYK